MYFLKKFRKSQTRFSGKPREISLQSKEFQREKVVGVVLMGEEKAFTEEKENLTSCTKLCCFKESFILGAGLLSRWYRSKFLGRC